MAEMSLERACGWMNHTAFDGVDDWEIEAGSVYSPSLRRRYTAARAIAEAAKFATRLAAPPAERAGGRPEAGQLSGDSGQLGRSTVQTRQLIDLIERFRPIDNQNRVHVELAGSGAKALASELRALLAAAERGAGAEAGPATRRIVGSVAKHLAHGNGGTVVFVTSGVALHPSDAIAALRELNMEPPR